MLKFKNLFTNFENSENYLQDTISWKVFCAFFVQNFGVCMYVF